MGGGICIPPSHSPCKLCTAPFHSPPLHWGGGGLAPPCACVRVLSSLRPCAFFICLRPCVLADLRPDLMCGPVLEVRWGELLRWWGCVSHRIDQVDNTRAYALAIMFESTMNLLSWSLIALPLTFSPTITLPARTLSKSD